jgi:hypothetical protein
VQIQVPQCPSDSIGTWPNCRCKPGTEGQPGDCSGPPSTTPTCPPDSVVAGTGCRCKQGTHGTPGKCQPNETGPSGPNIQGGGGTLTPNLQLDLPLLLPRQGGGQQQQQQLQKEPGPPPGNTCPPGTIGIPPICLPAPQ